ncbi:MAG: ABC transporter permease [Pirellulales bacterium]
MAFRWLRTWQLGVKSLLVHPLRSLLTVLGIFIGVASVIWLVAIGEGISLQAQRQIEDLGATNIIIRSVKPTVIEGDGFPQFGVTREDRDVIEATIPTIEKVLPIREIPRRVTYGQKSLDARLVGCTPDYATVMRLSVARGHFPTTTELNGTDNVCALAAELAATLFPISDPIGKQISIEKSDGAPEAFVVVGVMKARSAMAGIGGSLDSVQFNADIYVPITTFWARYGDLIVVPRPGSFTGEEVQLTQLTLQVRSVDEVMETTAAVRHLMERRHQQPDYSVVVPQELIEQARTTRLMFIVLMGLIAAISLVVGGIGIMNIMLATVTERTREIGIRRALGAKKGDITRQFLVETIALSVVGGVTGIIVGLACPISVEWMRSGLEQTFPEAMANLPDVVKSAAPVIVPWSIPLAFGISVVVGVLFGLYPAIRAAAMDPIEALRHE